MISKQINNKNKEISKQRSEGLLTDEIKLLLSSRFCVKHDSSNVRESENRNPGMLWIDMASAVENTS